MQPPSVPHRRVIALSFALGLCHIAAPRAAPAQEPQTTGRARPAQRYFRITVVDDETNRGVPLVELTTVNGITHVTDSAGVVAFREPGLMSKDVFFFVKSHGYEYPEDGFEMAGLTLRTKSGGSATLRIRRINIAQRLYRITGHGIYRDSVMLGDEPSLAKPIQNGRVLGQDSVQRALYRGKIYWFWGDTNRASYPLGNFAMSGATSELPTFAGGTGLDPSVGINLTYFVDKEGFSRGMCPIKDKPGPVWCDGMTTVADETGRERLLCRFVRVKTLDEMYEQGFALYNDEKEMFEPIKRIPLDTPLYMHGTPLRVTNDDGDYWYFAYPFPLVRCRADYQSLLDPAQYEAYTCLEPGARYDAEKPRLDRKDGRLVYGWKKDTAVVLQKQQNELIEKGLVKPDEVLIRLHDADTSKPVLGHSGTVAWNEYRKKWIMIVQELWGASMLGEVWYAEAPDLTGPWGPARKIITHDDYSFYNVAHHPFFDQKGGRIIYLEGTYTKSFSSSKVATPRYDYNQIMYSLDLADPRLKLE